MSLPHTFIYGLADPLSKKIHYVGKSDHPNKRLTQHLKDGKSKRTKKARWIRSLTSRRLTPDLVILEEVATSKWADAERRWIRTLRKSGHPLTNQAPGGVYIPPSKRRKKRKGRFRGGLV